MFEESAHAQLLQVGYSLFLLRLKLSRELFLCSRLLEEGALAHLLGPQVVPRRPATGQSLLQQPANKTEASEGVRPLANGLGD